MIRVDDGTTVEEAQRRSLLEASRDALAIIGSDAKLADVNAALQTVTGRSRSELLGSDASLYFTDPEQARQLYRDARAHGSVRDRPLELVHRDGHVTCVSCSASAYRDPKGTVIGVVAAARPIASFSPDVSAAASDPTLLKAAAALVRAASVLGLCVGAGTLLGWQLDLDSLQLLSVPSTPTTRAVGFQLAAAAVGLWLLRKPAQPTATVRVLAGRALGAGVCALGAVDAVIGRAPLGVAFVAFGLGLLFMDLTLTLRSRSYWVAHGPAFVTGMTAIGGLLESVLGVRGLVGIDGVTSIGLLGLALGLVCARTDYGLGALLTSPSLGGMLARRLWPSAILIPTLLAVFMRRADVQSPVPAAGRLTLMILSLIAWLGAVAVWNGYRIDRSDRLRQSMQEALRRREHELREAHRLARIGSWRWDLDAARLTWSPELYRILGLEPTEAPVAPDALLRHQTAESAARFLAALDRARTHGEPFELEITLLLVGDIERFAMARGEAERDAEGGIVLLRGTIEDITERKLAQAELARLNRAQRASSRCNQVLVRASDEATLLQQICDIIVETTDHRFCWVGKAEADVGKTVRLLAHAGPADGYVAGSTFSWAEDAPDPDAVGLCIRSREVVLISDISSDPRASAWHDRAQAHGYASLIVIPLSVESQLFGVLTIYSAQRAAFGSREVALLRELADDLAYGMTALRTRDAHARAEADVRSLNADLEARVQARTAELRDANEAKDRLLVHQQTISTELERARGREADLGFRIQQTLLLGAPPSDIPGLAVAARTLPSQRVDGDFYAFVDHQDQVVDVMVGDVMGKGILAALIGAATKTHILEALGDLSSSKCGQTLPRPKDIVMMAHAGLARHLIDLESFVTLCYARIDMRQRRLQFVDCGHTGIILKRGATGELSLLHGDNLPLGVREGELYEQTSVPLEPGDTLLLFSDGITDARDSAGNTFGLERLKTCVREHGPEGPQALLDAINLAVKRFSTNLVPSDDQTCVAVHVEAKLLPLFHSEIEIRSDLKELGRAREFVRSFCGSVPDRPLDDTGITELELATTEAASNIMKHAYAGSPDHLIRLEGDAYRDGVSVRLRHMGSPFDPENVPTPNFSGMRESGFGTYIIASSVDEVKYYRDANGRNCVALSKRPKRTAEETQSWS